MTAARKDIRRDMGASMPWRMTWRQGRNLPSVDLTGSSAVFSLSDRLGGPETMLTDANGGIVLGGPAGTIEVQLSHPDYQALPAGEYTYALAIFYSNGNKEFILRGTWSIQ